MTKLIKVAPIEELPESGSKGFQLIDGQWLLDFFIVRSDSTYYAYLNQCPHTGIGLNWKPNEFLNSDGNLIQCSTHGAQFRIEDGYCLYGPCAGQSLKPIELQIQEGYFSILLNWD